MRSYKPRNRELAEVSRRQREDVSWVITPEGPFARIAIQSQSNERASPRATRALPFPWKGKGPLLFRMLFQYPHLEGAHKHHGHALAGDVLTGREVLARIGVVTLDEALARRPGEGRARPGARLGAVGEGR